MIVAVRGLQLLVGGALVALGLDALNFSAWRLLLAAGLLLFYGVALYVGAINGLRRRGLGAGAVQVLVAVTGLCVLAPFAWKALSMLGGPSGEQYARGDDGRGGGDRRHAVTGDPELGWSAQNGPEQVGLRGQTIDPAREHVVFLGDSVLHGTGVGDDETAAHYLGGLLPQYQVLNASVPGWSIDQYYLYLKRILPKLRPKVVVVGIYAGNDYQVTAMRNGWEVPKPQYRLRDGALYLDPSRDLRAGCARFVSQRALFYPWRDDKPVLRGLIEFFCQPFVLGKRELEEVIAKLFAGIEQLAAEKGAKTLFVLLSNMNHAQQLRDDTFRYRSRYVHLRDLIERGGHALYELYPDLLRAGDEPTLFVAPGHYSPRGQRQFAASLLAELRRRGFVAAAR